MDKIQQGIFLDQESEDLQLSIVQPEEVGQVSDFLLAHFFAQEPLGAHLGLDPEKEVRSWLPNVLDHEIKEGVSILARNKISGEIVAVCINDVIRREEDPNDVTVFSYVQRDEQPSMWRIGQILEALLDGQDLFADHDRPGVIILQMLSVRPDQTGRGLAAKLIQATENLSRQDPKGQFGLVVSEATSQFSFRAFLRAGFVSIKRIQYEEFELDGEKSSPERPFRLLGERSIHTGADLMIKKIC